MTTFTKQLIKEIVSDHFMLRDSMDWSREKQYLKQMLYGNF